METGRSKLLEKKNGGAGGTMGKTPQTTLILFLGPPQEDTSFHFVFSSILFVKTFQGILMALALFDENVCVISIPTQQNCQRRIREERESAN